MSDKTLEHFDLDDDWWTRMYPPARVDCVAWNEIQGVSYESDLSPRIPIMLKS